MQFIILKREVFYTDKVWSNWIRVIPKDKALLGRIVKSRNKIPQQLIRMFNLSKKELEEYNAAKDDDAIAEIIIRDATGKGCKFEKRIEEWMKN